MNEVQQQQNLEQILTTLGNLPSSPEVVSLVMGMTADLNTDVRELSKALASDPAMAARALKLSNSSFYGRPANVSSVEEAVMVLGFFTVRSLVVATATYELFNTANDSENPACKLWEHSLATEIVARQIAQRITHDQVEECFLAGLMHDRCKLLLLQKFPEQYKALTDEQEPGADALACERETFGFGHDELGAALLTAWTFPEALVTAIADHHNRVVINEGGTKPISIVANLASAIARDIGVGFCPLENSEEFLVEHFWSAQALSIDDATLADLRNTLAENFHQERSLFV